MRLTTFSDYAVRVLMYAQASPDRLVTIEETANAYGISRAHLMKVVNKLTRAGYLRTIRGRAGGFTLAMPAAEINLGAVIRLTEPDFMLAECFGDGNGCLIANHCGMPRILNEALRAFVDVLDKYTLADLPLDRVAFAGPGEEPRRRRGPVLDPARETG